MKFDIENLGPLKEASIELNKLTIICGENNTGKTYLSYVIYGFIKLWKNSSSITISEERYKTLQENGRLILSIKEMLPSKDEWASISSDYQKNLKRILALPAKKLEETKIKFTPHENLSDKLYSQEIKESFFLGDELEINIEKQKDSDSFTVLMIKKTSHSNPDIHADQWDVKIVIERGITDIIFNFLFPNMFIVSAERTGILTFKAELNLARSMFYDTFQRNKKEISEQMKSHFLHWISRETPDIDYPMPIRDNIRYINDLERLERNISEITEKRPDILESLENIAGGSYKTTQSGDITFSPQGSSTLQLRMNATSSTAKSLVLLNYYIRFSAKKGDFLIIDEPELNLHPQNQRNLARLIVQLINFGIDVFVTTHSDYFVKELNLMIMLGSEKSGISEIKSKHNYKDDEILDFNHVSLYTTEKEYESKKITLEKADVDPILGIDAKSFDRVINEMNSLENSLLDILQY
jgi:hypothetical protein